MTDKIKKILDKIQTRKLCTMDEHMGFYSKNAEADYKLLSKIEELIKSLQEEPVSEDLKEAAVEWFNSVKYKSDLSGTPINAFKAGAKWKEQQMKSKAIDGVVTFDYYGDGDKTYGCIAHDSFCLEDFGLKDNDMIKMVLIKKD